jgi:hypothetical protein
MNYTQQQLADLIKKLIPTATETESTVTLSIQGIDVKYIKNKAVTKTAKRSQGILR